MSSGAWGRGIGEADEREVGSVSEGRGAPRAGSLRPWWPDGYTCQMLNLLGQALGWVLADARKKNYNFITRHYNICILGGRNVVVRAEFRPRRNFNAGR